MSLLRFFSKKQVSYLIVAGLLCPREGYINLGVFAEGFFSSWVHTFSNSMM